MGCQCSQATSTMPQQPHPLVPQPIPHQTKEPTPQIPLQAAAPPTTHDKENQHPREPTQKGNKLLGDKWAVSETNIKAKTEKRKSEVPILDATNLSKLNEATKQKSGKEEKAATSRSEYKIEDEPSLGPSSKSIELVESFKEEHKQEKKPDTDRKSEKKVEPEKKQEKKGVPQDKSFVFEHWQKPQEEQLSRTERLRIVDQMQIQREEVCQYLNQVWDYEKEVVNDIIDQLEQHQQKRFLQPVQVVQMDVK